jgi:phenylacetate-coenzyme A ligase PaaK-like adenylate-forming protein
MTTAHQDLTGTKRLGAGPAPGELSAAERISRDELQARQLDRLRHTLRYAYDPRPAFRRMDKVTGRTEDMIILRGVNIFPTQIEEIVLVTEGVSPHFQLLLTRKDRMDQLTVLVEAESPAPGGRREAAAAVIAARVRDGLGINVAVEVVDPDTLERSVGKMRRVIDQRPT